VSETTIILGTYAVLVTALFLYRESWHSRQQDKLLTRIQAPGIVEHRERVSTRRMPEPSPKTKDKAGPTRPHIPESIEPIRASFEAGFAHITSPMNESSEPHEQTS